MVHVRKLLRPGVVGFVLAAIPAAAWVVALRPTSDQRGPLLHGDLNLDGAVDLADVEPFAIAAGDNQRWQDLYDASFESLLSIGDFNGDGLVDPRDSIGFGSTIATYMAVHGGAGTRADGSDDLFPASIIGEAQRAGVRGFSEGVPIDLDIDSDNTDGTNRPARTDAEEAVEMNSPGKFILVNDDDDDFNGAIDSGQNGANNQERDDLAPLVLELPGDGDGENVTYLLQYPTNVRVWRSASRGNTAPGSPDIVPSLTP